MLRILHYPLSGPDLIYISLWIIFCIIVYVTNKKNLEPCHGGREAISLAYEVRGLHLLAFSYTLPGVWFPPKLHLE